MQTMHDWTVKRSGTGMRIKGTHYDGVSLTRMNHKVQVTSIWVDLGGFVYAADKDGERIKLLVR